MKPKEIILYQHGIGDSVKILEYLKSRFDITEIGTKCTRMGMYDFDRRKVSSKFVCVFDNDTIFEYRGLEKEHSEMAQPERRDGTIGIRMNRPGKYPHDNGKAWRRIPWDNLNDETMQVDFIGHSCFFKKDWLNWFFDPSQEVKTFISFHPRNRLKFYRSDSKSAIELGDKKDKCYKMFSGWNGGIWQ